MNPLFDRRHVMLDTETTGKRPGCPVLSIGAVVFTPDGFQGGFYEKIMLESCHALGLVSDQSTLDWWAEQSEEARKEAFEGATLTVTEVLDRLDAWFPTTGASSLWCHGASFDAPILDAIYDKLGRTAPWKFWNVRDTRTLYDLSGIQPDRTNGTHHHALHDAQNQATAAIAAIKALGVWS